MKKTKILNTYEKCSMPTIDILLVDDDSDESYLFNEALDHSGLDVRLSRANNGNDLLSILATESLPDIVFLDLNMPYKDGIEAIIEIRSNPKYKDLKLVIYSTSQAEASINACYQKGADLYVVKPNNFDGMVELIKKVCAMDWKNFSKLSKEQFVIKV